MINWPEDLVNAVARRRSVLFLGAGVSMNSKNAAGLHPPSWQEFLEAGIAECSPPRKELNTYLKGGDFLTCCQLIKYKMGAHWVSFLEKKFLEPHFKSAVIHQNIFNLDSSIVITPNFDKIYDNFASTATSNFLKIKKYDDEDIARVLRGNEKQRLIIKLHGCIDSPDKLVFTREDYALVRHRHANFYRAIDALILTHTFLFIGCGLNDPDLALVLEQYTQSFKAAPPHYLLMSKSVSPDYEKMLLDTYNVHLIKYSSKAGHSELTEALENLGKLVEVRRAELADAMLW